MASALVILCHPSSQSYATAMAGAAVKALKGAGHIVTLLDLYAEGLAVPLDERQWRTYFDPAAQRLEPYATQIADAEIVVLVFPLWYLHIPAALKAYMERVWTPEVAYRDGAASADGRPRPLLGKMRHMVAISCFSLPSWVLDLILRNPPRRYLRLVTRFIAGGSVKFHWLGLGAVDKGGPERRHRFLETIERRLGALKA